MTISNEEHGTCTEVVLYLSQFAQRSWSQIVVNVPGTTIVSCLDHGFGHRIDQDRIVFGSEAVRDLVGMHGLLVLLDVFGDAVREHSLRAKHTYIQ